MIAPQFGHLQKKVLKYVFENANSKTKLLPVFFFIFFFLVYKMLWKGYTPCF